MKQLLFVGLLLSGAFTNEALPTSTPEAVKKKFDQLYPDAADVIWDYWEEDQLHLAIFDHDGYASEAYFKEDGTWVKTLIAIAEFELPENVLEYLESRYPELDFISYTARVEIPDYSYYQVNIEVEQEEETIGYTLNFDLKGNPIDQ